MDTVFPGTLLPPRRPRGGGVVADNAYIAVPGGAMTCSGIVAGYDGSAGAEQAIAWAAREAQSRRSVLTVCLAPSPGYPAPRSAERDSESRRRAAEEALAPGLRLARDLVRGGEVRPLVAAQPPAGALCELSADADMVVVGALGRGAVSGFPIGSVSLRVAAAGRGRVVVVRGHWQPVVGHDPRPVVVGSDGSPESAPAVAFAFEEAALRETNLLAVCALCDEPGLLGVADQIRDDFEELVARQQRDHSAVTVCPQVSEGAARAALRDAAVAAQMLVVGARGRGGIKDLPMGSVAVTVLSSARSPVAIVHPDE